MTEVLARPPWTHIIELNADTHIYCYRVGDALRACGDDIKAPGQVVAVWDTARRDWWLVDGFGVTEAARYCVRQACQERVQQPRPHRITIWAESESRRRHLPWVLSFRNGKEQVTEGKFPPRAKWAAAGGEGGRHAQR